MYFIFSGVATGGASGGRMPPLTAKNLPKIRKKGKKSEKSGRKGKNRESSFTLPLLTDWAGYAILFIRLLRNKFVNGWQLAKMKKSIPDMSLP